MNPEIFEKSQSLRRNFLRQAGAGLAAIPVAGSIKASVANDTGPFTHGIASGDPLGDRVILWTRVNPSLGARVTVLWDVAFDINFTSFIRRGRAITTVASDHTVKVDVIGLPSDTVLYYRFRVGTNFSATGRTRTLPVGPTAQVKLAVFSCSNFPAGYFHAYGEAALEPELHAAIHLGDYIYEYQANGYPPRDAVALNREPEPVNEILTLADYRLRHAQYRTDIDLQELTASVPLIAVWDDHELANDAWRDGAQNHTAPSVGPNGEILPGEGPYSARRAAALQAYHEWMPIRTPDPTRYEKIFRSFSFGDLVDLHMLDTRIIGRDRQLSYANYNFSVPASAAQFQVDMANPNRQMLGAEQFNWLAQRMAATNGRWTILGQQVLMGRMNVPSPLVLFQISFSDYVALTQLAQTNPGALTPQQIAILNAPSIPYNLDAWDGYVVAREQVLGTARLLRKNLVVLAGDTHNAWASNLADLQGRAVGVEFATHSVSSPGFEEFFPNENPAVVAAGLAQLIGPLVWANTQYRGYMLVTATQAECRSEWKFVSTVKSGSYTMLASHSQKVLAGNPQIITG
jgi:alkaline phosphatase D